MAFFEDLRPCTAFPPEWRGLRAVGWLAKGQAYRTGPSDAELLRRIDAMLAAAWQPPSLPSSRWGHTCDLCGNFARGTLNLFVPAEGVLYVAPELIRNYIAMHEYHPPPEFVAAVMSCPPMGSPEYLAAVSPFMPPTTVVRPMGPVESLEPVRMRPGMYIGGTDQVGLGHMFFEVVGNSLDQYLLGAATRISVEIAPDGWITVEDDGAGIPIEPLSQGPSFLELVFTTLHFTPTLDAHHPHIHVRPGLAGIGVGAVSALSARLEVMTVRDGREYAAVFERGRTVSPVQSLGETSRKGTRVRYLPDEEIFGDVHLEPRSLVTRFEQLGALCPRLDLRLQRKSYQRREGLLGWVHELAPKAVSETSLSGSGTSDNVGVDFAIAWKRRGRGQQVRSFVNFGATVEGGSHVQGLVDAVRSTAPTPTAAEDAVRGLVGVVHVTLLHPRFGGPTKSLLQTGAARAAVREVLAQKLSSSPWWWDRLIEEMNPHPGKRRPARRK